MTKLQEFPAYARLDLPVVAAEGCELVLADGRRVLDLYGGHCVNTLGAGDPGLGATLAGQWQANSFVTNLLPHQARAAFESAVAPLLPPLADGDCWQYFCSNSGAEANENAIKLALTATGRDVVVGFTGAFHGRTAGAAALNDPPAGRWPQAPYTVRRLPWGSVDGIGSDVAAVVLEPIQSLAGVVDPPPGFLAALRAACDASGARLVYDEVQTGNGRLGTPWAAQHYGVVPDLYTTAKGAAGGLPIGLTFARASAVAGVPGNALGSTFGGGPVAMAAAAEVARRIAGPGFLDNVAATSAVFRQAAGHGAVRRVRGAGLLLGLELEATVPAKALRDALLAQDILTGTSNDPQVLRLSPALTLTPAQAGTLLEALDRVFLTA